MIKSNKNLINWLGLLGIASFVSYGAAVIFAPSAYPGYDWMSRAVSDLSAANAPSLALWHQLATAYGTAGLVCIMAVCIAIQGKLNKTLRSGIYLFAAMFWVSVIGFGMFPLSQSGGIDTTFQDIAHFAVTAVVVLLCIASLVLIMIGGYRKKRFMSLAIYATIALVLMFVGAIGTGVAPREYFGVFQRFSNLIATNGFLMILGLYLFLGKLEKEVGS